MDFVEYWIYFPPSKDSVLTFLFPYLKDYIWFSDSFHLEEKDSILTGKMKLELETNDEWFLLGLLIELSAKFPQSVIRIVDNDGEFPLIEASDYLPDWAQDPEVAENRVYFHKSKLHIIPLTLIDSDTTEINILDAIKLIKDRPDVTEASNLVQISIKKRLGGFPNDFTSVLHFANVRLPLKAAFVLKSSPHLISPSIRCLESKDRLDDKLLRKMETFPTQNLVEYRVKFTKTLFTVISSIDFVPDKRHGSLYRLDSKLDKLGAKLQAGLEILAGQCSGKPEYDPLMKKYVQSLTNSGYFKGLLPGSKEYSSLLLRAQSFFSMEVSDTHSLDLARVLESYDEQEPFESEPGPDDDESWMEFDKDKFDSYLSASFGMDKLDDVGKKLNNFIETVSDYKGVEDSSVNFDPEAILEKLKNLVCLDDENKEDENKDSTMKEYFEALENELKDTYAAPVYETENVKSMEDLKKRLTEPNNLNATVAKNLYKSIENQNEGPGPVFSILKDL